MPCARAPGQALVFLKTRKHFAPCRTAPSTVISASFCACSCRKLNRSSTAFTAPVLASPRRPWRRAARRRPSRPLPAGALAAHRLHHHAPPSPAADYRRVRHRRLFCDGGTDHRAHRKTPRGLGVPTVTPVLLPHRDSGDFSSPSSHEPKSLSSGTRPTSRRVSARLSLFFK